MSSTVLYTIISLSLLGLSAALILYFVAQKFKVFEDPRIDQVEQVLPGANCGGCGYPGCRNFAEALVNAESFDGLNCPVGGAETMGQAASLLGKEPVEVEPRVAVVRCNGTPEHRPRTTLYDGAPNCTFTNQESKSSLTIRSINQSPLISMRSLLRQTDNRYSFHGSTDEYRKKHDVSVPRF